MIIVITGALYTGRIVMTRAVLDSVQDATMLPIVTTKEHIEPGASDLPYTKVSAGEFESRLEKGEFIGSSDFGETLYGIQYVDMEEAIKRGTPVVIMCDANIAQHIGRYLRSNNLFGVCIYMHCSVRAMLFRMADIGDSTHQESHAVVQSIYGNHAIDYNNLHMDVDSGIGFVRVIPVNSDAMSWSSYPEKVIAPLLLVLESYAKKNPLPKVE